eukprot:scaffold28462_cov25-Tisochrysis_lutea.AAC.1
MPPLLTFLAAWVHRFYATGTATFTIHTSKADVHRATCKHATQVERTARDLHRPNVPMFGPLGGRNRPLSVQHTLILVGECGTSQRLSTTHCVSLCHAAIKRPAPWCQRAACAKPPRSGCPQ